MPDISLKIIETRAMKLPVANRFSTRAFTPIYQEGTLPFAAPRDAGDLLKNKKYLIGALDIFISRGANSGINWQCGEEGSPFPAALLEGVEE